MRKIVLTGAMFIATVMMVIGQSDYKMMELVYLKPIPGTDLDEAVKAIADHNKKYHAEEPFKATVWSNLTGSMVGTWVWVMYPGTFTDYDGRPGGKDHDGDWDKAVLPYFTLVANEYWKEDDKLSYYPEERKDGDKVVFTVFDIKPGESYRFKALLKKVHEVYKEKAYDRNFSVYYNQFENKCGRDVAIEVMFDKWAFLDEDHSMKNDFEEVHGEGSWMMAIEEYRDVVVSAEDELSVLMKEMSAE
jgi:hypothetical protein